MSWCLLAGSTVLVMDRLNSGIEAVVDRIGPEIHPLSQKTKDCGTAVVLLSLLMCGLT